MPVVSRLIYEVANATLLRNRSSRIRRGHPRTCRSADATAREDKTALPELSVTSEKQQVVARTARRFLLERHVKECPMRFDVVAIEEVRGESPVVRLHKAAFYPQM